MSRAIVTGSLVDRVLAYAHWDERERDRYRTLVELLRNWCGLFNGRRALDFGASWGTSMVALRQMGAAEVVGVEPDAERVEQGRDMFQAVAPDEPFQLDHASETDRLPFADGEFSFILANAVLEHIPQPRASYLREIWRVLAPGGYLMINETPNSFFPKDLHTTDLWFNHWLPKGMAYRRAVRNGRFRVERTDWEGSGWRGMHYFEMVRPLSNYALIPDNTRLRHRVFSALGIPASIIDPYPTWVLRKNR